MTVFSFAGNTIVRGDLMNKIQSKDNQKRNHGTYIKLSLLTGLIGGVFWSGIGVVLYYFNFTKVSIKSYVLNFWLKTNWVDSWIGDIVSVLIIGLLSMLVAVIFYLLFKKHNSMWTGIIYGVFLWFIVIYFINPLYPNIPTLAELDKNTLITTLSLFCLYGVFIGYTITFDYNDNRISVKEDES